MMDTKDDCPSVWKPCQGLPFYSQIALAKILGLRQIGKGLVGLGVEIVTTRAQEIRARKLKTPLHDSLAYGKPQVE